MRSSSKSPKRLHSCCSQQPCASRMTVKEEERGLLQKRELIIMYNAQYKAKLDFWDANKKPLRCTDQLSEALLPECPEEKPPTCFLWITTGKCLKFSF